MQASIQAMLLALQHFTFSDLDVQFENAILPAA